MASGRHTPPPSYAETNLRPVSPTFYQPRIRDFQPYVPPRDPNSETASTASKPPPMYTARQVRKPRTEEDYLKDLRRWAQTQELATVSEDALVGFYGHRTMNEYLPPSKQKELEQRLKYGRKGSKSSDSGSSEDGSGQEADKKKKGWLHRVSGYSG